MSVNIETNEFRQNVKKMIAKRVFVPEDQEDITQDVLVKVLRFARTEEPRSFFSWLKMAVNSSIGDFYRKKGIKKEEPIDNVEVSALSQDEELTRDLTCCIDPFLNKMDADESKLIREIDLNGKEQLELANSLNMKYSTLKSRLQKSRKKLLESISACCPPESDSCTRRGNPCD